MHRVMEECLFIPIEDNVLNARRIFCTNDAGGRIWELLDGSRTVAEIGRLIAEEYGI